MYSKSYSIKSLARRKLARSWTLRCAGLSTKLAGTCKCNHSSAVVPCWYTQACLYAHIPLANHKGERKIRQHSCDNIVRMLYATLLRCHMFSTSGNHPPASSSRWAKSSLLHPEGQCSTVFDMQTGSQHLICTGVDGHLRGLHWIMSNSSKQSDWRKVKYAADDRIPWANCGVKLSTSFVKLLQL